MGLLILPSLLIMLLFCFNGASLEQLCKENGIYTKKYEKCYHIFTELATFIDAERRCEDLGGTLVTFRNKPEIKELHWIVIEKLNIIGYWIGAFYLGGWAYVTQKPIIGAYWAEGTPKNTSDLRCVSSSADDGRWWDVDCYQKQYFICQTEPLASSPDLPTDEDSPWFYHNATNAWYKAIRRSLNWTENERLCTEENAHLASIHSAIEHDTVNEICHNKIVAIGLNFPAGQNQQNWIDGTPVDFTFWAKDEPNLQYECSFIWSKYTEWKTWTCSYPSCGVCKKT